MLKFFAYCMKEETGETLPSVLKETQWTKKKKKKHVLGKAPTARYHSFC